ncbi:MAG TPA: hypothetical protein VHU92_02640 [Streptosporangiaceae bacterium]|nr:hypothetical protein [Streptosporangiaceae bacterium]
MTSTEDRVRDAFRADAQTIQPGTIRPRADLADVAEPAPGGRTRGAGSAVPLRRVLIPLGAAAAVAAIVAGVALVSSGGSSVGPVAGPWAYAPSGPKRPAPRYLVGAGPSRGGLGVYDASTGRRITVITPPTGGLTFDGDAATSNDRVFVVAASPGHGCYTNLYRLSLTAGGRLAGLAPLAVPRVTGTLLGSTALAASASGQVIGYSASCSGRNGWVGVIRLASRRVRRWSLSSQGLFSMSMSSGGQTLFFDNTGVYGGDGTIRALPTSAPPGPMLRRARIVLPASSGVDTTGSVAVTGGGKILLGCREIQSLAVLASYSAASGRQLAVLHTWRHVDAAPCMISVTPSGGYVLASVIGPGGGTRLDLYTGKARTIGRDVGEAVGIAW